MRPSVMRGAVASPASAIAATVCALFIGATGTHGMAAEPSGAGVAQEARIASRPAPARAGRAAVPAKQPAAPKIQVTRATPETGPSPALRSAYNALQARDYGTAGPLYEQLARADPRNLDVLLGQAAIALHRGDVDNARSHYVAVLRLEPSNTAAQGALLALFGRADYATAELRLKALADREPSAFLYQALGTLYAEQALWPQAQHAYFQAHRLDVRNADHAYNLAVSLEHVGQRALAGTYYRRAVDLARTQVATGFDVSRAENRAASLSAASGD